MSGFRKRNGRFMKKKVHDRGTKLLTTNKILMWTTGYQVTTTSLRMYLQLLNKQLLVFKCHRGREFSYRM